MPCTQETRRPIGLMGRLLTEWKTDDPRIGELLTLVQDMTDREAQCEMLAALHTWQAQDYIREAERLAVLRRAREARRQLAQARR